jgi:hypothetical protein
MIQLSFHCPECDLSGLSPELDDQKAIRVVLRQLRLRCPACSAVVEVTDPLSSVLMQIAGNRLESTGQPLLEQVSEAIRAQLARQKASKGKAQSSGKDGGSAGGEG